MSNVRGRIAVDVQFADSTTSEGVQSLKTITLQDATEYTTGKVAVVTGTVGTTLVQIDVSPATTYKNAAGSVVSFTGVQRFSFSATGSPARLQQDYIAVESSAGRVCVSNANGFDDSFSVQTTSGTASYTLVMYGT